MANLSSPILHPSMATWRCIKQCGACCYLDPAERPDLEEYLSPEELDHYLSLVGEDGWCINFNHLTKECQIYRDRPRFCRVETEVFQDLYQVEAQELNDFAIECCIEHIEDMYGEQSLELLRFKREVGVPVTVDISLI